MTVEPSPTRSTPRGSWKAIAASSLPAFAVLYVTLYSAFGTESPFFPSFLLTRGLSPQQIGILLSAGTVVRLVSGPLLGLAADLFGTRRVLAATAFAASTVIFLYLGSTGFLPMLLVSTIHSVAIAPLAPLADALALDASAREGVFSYGLVRGIGSAGFIAGTLVSGLSVARFGINSIIVVAAVLFFLMIVPIPWLPAARPASVALARGAIASLLANPLFRLMLFVSALVIGSHAMSDAFAVIQWRAAGVATSIIGLLWSEAVGSEIIVFMFLGPHLLRRFGAGPCAAIAAAAGALRWAVIAQTASITALVATQLLHGLTFSLMHLACMQVIAITVPNRIAATAQTLYGTFCLGIASATLTFLSGEMYAPFGAHAFWLMSGLCIVAIPFAVRL